MPEVPEEANPGVSASVAHSSRDELRSPGRAASGAVNSSRDELGGQKNVTPGFGIVLFDGTCAFCEGSVKFIARRDPAGYFRFGASQSEAGARLLASHGLTREMTRSMVLLEGDRLYLRSEATLRIAKRLPFPWRLAGALLWIPRPLRDAGYRVVAAVRHRIAGKSNACEIPPPELRGRMI